MTKQPQDLVSGENEGWRGWKDTGRKGNDKGWNEERKSRVAKALPSTKKQEKNTPVKIPKLSSSFSHAKINLFRKRCEFVYSFFDYNKRMLTFEWSGKYWQLYSEDFLRLNTMLSVISEIVKSEQPLGKINLFVQLRRQHVITRTEVIWSVIHILIVLLISPVSTLE